MNDNSQVMFFLKKWGVSYIDKGEYLVMKTICHGGDSDKLYFYKSSNLFYCYTHCHSMSLATMVSKVENIPISEAKFKVSNNKSIDGFSQLYTTVNPVEKINKIKKYDMKEDLPVLKNNVLNGYYPIGIKEWSNEGISLLTQKKFNICYDLQQNQIIIPHKYYRDGQLVGVRGRRLDKNIIDSYGKYMPVYQGTRSLSYPVHENLYGLWENISNIKNTKKVVIFEAEKSVMMLDTFMRGKGNGVALSGSSFSGYQYRILMSLPIDEVIIALDKEFQNHKEEILQSKKITKTFSKLTSRFMVSVIWDSDGLLDYKDSPTDKGFDIYKTLYERRKYFG